MDLQLLQLSIFSNRYSHILIRIRHIVHYTHRLATMEWAKQRYNEQYEVWWPWIEDNFLRYFTKDNKASYATKGTYLPPFLQSFIHPIVTLWQF